jgi:hypothetical protein
VIRKLKIPIILVLILSANTAWSQGKGFLDHLRIGFGAGANSSHILDLESYNVYEDLAGNTYRNNYTGMIRNIGNQYFVHAEWYNDFMVLVLKPGTYTHRFGKVNEVVFNSETVEQLTSYLLRYFSVPLEVRYNLNLDRFRPYAGLTATYSHLLGSMDAANHTFIHPRFGAGVVAGTYIDLRYIILDLNAGYRAGLHNIASKANRFGTGNGSTFAQDDLLLNDLQVSISVLFSLQKQRSYSNVECFY